MNIVQRLRDVFGHRDQDRTRKEVALDRLDVHVHATLERVDRQLEPWERIRAQATDANHRAAGRR